MTKVQGREVTQDFLSTQKYRRTEINEDRYLRETKSDMARKTLTSFEKKVELEATLSSLLDPEEGEETD